MLWLRLTSDPEEHKQKTKEVTDVNLVCRLLVADDIKLSVRTKRDADLSSSFPV